MGKTIALIDDSSVMRSIIRKSIMMSNLDISDFIEADNGLDGLQLIENNQDRLDLVITDLHMPKCSGVEMMEKLKEHGVNKAPIIVISTMSDAKMQETCKRLGAVAFLKKPFSHEDIETLLRDIL